jgi:hypothetical protein
MTGLKLIKRLKQRKNVGSDQLEKTLDQSNPTNFVARPTRFGRELDWTGRPISRSATTLQMP